jgi:hypothetical protein
MTVKLWKSLPGAAFAVIGAALFWVAFDGGSYSVSSRTSLAIVVLWIILLCVLLRVVQTAGLETLPRVIAVSLGAFAIWTLASAMWSSSTERAFIEFDRVALYLGVFLLGSWVGTRDAALRLRNALAFAVIAVLVVGLVSRFFPHLFSTRGLPEFLPGSATRLSFPLDYWNGLGIFLALGLPIWLEVALDTRLPYLARNAVVAVLPALSVALYLTSSRGAVATAAAGLLAFIAISRERWAPLSALTAGIVGSLSTFLLLHGFGLTDELLSSGLGAASGAEVTAVVVIGCAVAACTNALLRPLINRRPAPPLGIRTIAVLLAAFVVVGALFLHPVRRFESFKKPPPASANASGITSHLFSANGSGRWQFWTAAVNQFRTHPLKGTGAGTYEEWWLQHRTIVVYVRDAHSLWLEVLGELGVVGFVLIALPFAAAIMFGARRVMELPAGGSAPAAGAFAVVVAYCVAAGVDWMWELTAVSVFAFLCLGLLAGSGSERHERRRRDAHSARAIRWLVSAISVLILAGLIYAQAIALLADRDIRASQDASRQGSFADALSRVDDARRLEPWAATPYLQRALIEERLGLLRAAATSVRKAIRRDPNDWRLWFVAARVETERGAISNAVRSIHEAQRLDPRAPFTQEP